ncbi:MAG: hypothetical protein ACRBB0_24180 [Pelagimonas sp.]|uniref:hypothetical protein n=1 Tax=Pelagimonas sp. TaxID=2073170 RepID=UPI003D6A159D
MNAIEILRDALFVILINWRQAIRIFLVPLGLIVGVFASVMIFGTLSVKIDGQTVQVPSPFLFVLFPLFLFLIFWPVVAWHRLLVLGEQPTGFAPTIKFKPVLRYVLNLFGLGMLISLLMLPVMAFIGPMMISELDPEAISRGEMPPLKFFIWPTLASLPALYLGIRLCLILPGAAVENHVGLSGSWDYTSSKGTSLLLIVLLAATFSIVLQIILSAITPSLFEAPQGVLTVFQLTQFIGQMIGSLFVISVMSTMFLVFVQDKLPN